MSALLGIVGGFSVDHLVIDPIGARFGCLGGPGLYAAMGARIVAGVDVRLHSGLPWTIPDFETTLNLAGVDLSHCWQVDDVPRVWILNSAQGRRLVPTTAPPGREFSTDDETPFGEMMSDDGLTSQPGPRFLHGLTGILYCSPGRLAPHQPGPIVGVDPDQLTVLGEGWDYWTRVARPGGVLLPSRVQLTTVDPDPRAAARKLATTLGVSVAARLDVEGIYTTDRFGADWSVYDTDLQVMDTTGAGDASAGALLAALTAGADLVTAAAFGVSAARIVLSDWGHHALARTAPLTEPLPGIHTVRMTGVL